MAKYVLMRDNATQGTICKDGNCFGGCDVSAVDSTWRAVQWDGASGTAELCDGTDYDVNTGEQAISAESELSALATAWQAASDAHDAEVAAQAAQDAQLQAQSEASEEVSS